MGGMKLRFSLRTLLMLVTLCAVACWAYWIGWPWWLLYQEQSRLLAAARTLKPGTAWYVHLPNGTSRGCQLSIGEFPNNQLDMFSWPNVTYYILYEHENGPDGTIAKYKKIEVFKAPPPPPESKKWTLGDYGDYAREFFLMIGGDRKHNPGFKYELIYADPPSKNGANLPESSDESKQ